jgi:hypothetical protein
MRTDVIIDRKLVVCPNASTLGFGKWKAQVGNLVLFKENDKIVTGRMIGRIQYGYSDGKSLKNFLVVICISPRLDWTFERWVNPKDVTEIYDLKNEYAKHVEVLEHFLSDELVKAPIDEVRACSRDWSSLKLKRAYEAKREQELREYEARKAAKEGVTSA